MSASSDPTNLGPEEPASSSSEAKQPAQASTPTSSASASPSSAIPSPPLHQHQHQQRTRLTFEQMQQEARAKLGGMVRQQLEADRQQQQNQQQQPQPQDSEVTQTTTATPSPAYSTAAPGPTSPPSPAPPRASGATAPRQTTAAAQNTPTNSTTSSSSSTTSTSTSSTTSSVSDTAGATVAADDAQQQQQQEQQPPVSEWEETRQEWAEMWQRIRVRWRHFVERPLDPPSPQEHTRQAQPDGAAGAEATAEAGGGGVKRQAFVSRVVQLACVAVFVAQWAPLAHVLTGGAAAAQEAAAAAAGGSTTAAAAAGREVWLALLVASPPTPLTLSWQTDAISLSAGQYGSLLTSSLLHSGLVSLLVSLASLEETLPWLETLDGFMIMLLSYGMAGAVAGLTQLFLGGQATGIAGLAAALGTEVAVGVRCWRYTGGQLLPPTPACVALLGLSGLMAAYQPLVGTWGILGGILGGALSAVLAYDILYVMRVVIAVTILLGLGAWNLLSWLPRVLFRLVVGLVAVVWGTGVAVVQALRGV
ncbi:hypothetical protein VOLCADRAFT_119864 [Volvox carteri f. nagariensis]|uniref:Peptidase S54 rhomboid domain-containing protein n=1 Tax=Volvox carteri f. nagariensis TaxID=3068 RepID=D8UHK0_VOLCA|nr:uncharacterized protein VOLCADRAFT_119864 [Volvox carteri f. nagariensis]EFJ40758.1 hypothetical protein VOLCADRAFT_119864 [Volvox carteri f. nagariensis]|eukprot:XP_002958133.1 hypothetical protein VOLCADRAFT_119864 [Volvox carteri f. nagariensis]